MNRNHPLSSQDETIPAGNFSSWLRQIRESLLGNGGLDVPCGDCIGCCSSSYFIHIQPEEKQALGQIPREKLFPAPGQPKGHLLMGYDQEGRCPMLSGGKCSIYDHRPQTCRNYDCRIFVAAGIPAGGGEKAEINERVERWAFSYPSQKDRDEHRAVQAAAAFMRKRAKHFPGGHVPENPSELAILAIKSYTVFIGRETTDSPLTDSSCVELASEVVETCRHFDMTEDEPLTR